MKLISSYQFNKEILSKMEDKIVNILDYVIKHGNKEKYIRHMPIPINREWLNYFKNKNITKHKILKIEGTKICRIIILLEENNELKITLEFL